MLYAQQQRLNVMNRIKGTFIKYPERIIDKQKLISEIGNMFGSSRKKAAEYIRELLDAEFIIETLEGLQLKDMPKLSIEAEKEMAKIFQGDISNK